jgi:hypothetical protein
MSNPTLSPAECALLQYLHDHSAGWGERTSLDPKYVIRALRMGKPTFEAHVASLTAHGLAGARRFQADLERHGNGDVVSGSPSAVWITGKGEEFLRRRLSERRRAPGAEAR